MYIAVDFDGTIVEHRYPKIGREKPFAIETLKKLRKDGHQLILWTVREGRLLDEAVEFSQTNTLSDKYDCEVGALLPGENSFTLNAVFTPKNGKGDVEDFGSYKDAVLNDDGSVTVTIKGYTVEYGGQRVTYYMLNERCQGDAKIDVSDEGVRVVSNLSAIGNVLGAALGSAMMIVIATAAYIVGMLIIVIPSEIYLVLVRKKLLSEEKVSYR